MIIFKILAAIIAAALVLGLTVIMAIGWGSSKDEDISHETNVALLVLLGMVFVLMSIAFVSLII